MNLSYKKSARITIGTLLIYAVLVSTHQGEFWPFSIYPMFSQAGKPWNRAVVRDVTGISEDSLWYSTNREHLVGNPIPLNKLNINTNDIANFLSKNEVWNENKIRTIRKLFSNQIDSHDILLMRASGRLTEQDSVIVNFVPLIYLTRDTTILNHQLRTR